MTYPIRYIIAACLLVPLVASKCEKEEIALPACIQQKIDSIKQRPKSTPPAQVHTWLYRGSRVYLFSATEPNQNVMVFDEASCRYLCAPSGGVTGGGDSTCIDFYQEAQHLSLIWQDDR